MKIARFYPIVPNVEWLRRIVPLGVECIQLRIKGSTHEDIRSQIQESLKIVGTYHCQLIVNDYWDIACELGANFVHLGQEDIAEADHTYLRRAGIRLGISTHCVEELEIALSYNPAYVALGPIYETQLKVMKWPPQGLSRITEWRQRIGTLPLVAIGGLTPERAQGAITAGADSVAVITDIFSSSDPLARVKFWLRSVCCQETALKNKFI